MSVIMTFAVKGDPQKLEQYAADNADTMRSIADAAKQHGLIAHRFYGGDDGILVVDEWPDPQSFRSFFEQERARIEPMMQQSGADPGGGPQFWRKLETHDEVGWER